MIAASNLALDINEVEQLLFDTCDDIGVPGEDDTFGHGRVNLFNAMVFAANPVGVDFIPVSSIPDELEPLGVITLAPVPDPTAHVEVFMPYERDIGSLARLWAMVKQTANAE